jgi:hypothetical protein
LGCAEYLRGLRSSSIETLQLVFNSTATEVINACAGQVAEGMHESISDSALRRLKNQGLLLHQATLAVREVSAFKISFMNISFVDSIPIYYSFT